MLHIRNVCVCMCMLLDSLCLKIKIIQAMELDNPDLITIFLSLWKEVQVQEIRDEYRVNGESI